MQLSPHVEALQNDLAALSGMADEHTRETVHRIAGALESALRLRMLEAVTQAANEISGQLASGHVEVRLAGGDPQLVVAEQAEEVAPPVAGDEAPTARITLRLPEGLKLSVETAAAREGMSVNSWLIQAIARMVDRRGGGPVRSSRRLSGWARS